MSLVETTVASRQSRYLNDAQRQAIVSAVSSGIPQNVVAQQFGVNRVTVSKIMRSMRQATHDMLGGDWKQQQVTLGATAVNAGLRCEDDPYRRADLGVKVLTGLGVYKSEASSTTTNIYVNVQDLPSDWHSRMEFISGEPPAALDVASKVIDDTETQHD